MIGTLEQLFDYEQVEDAWISSAEKSDIVYREFCDDTKNASEAPYTEIQLTNVVPTGELYPFHNEQFPHEWKGQLTIRHVTMRGVNSDKQREMTGRTRLRIQRYRTIFTEARLPYHLVLQMRETALTRGVDDEMNDWSEIQAEIIFRVRENAWPK